MFTITPELLSRLDQEYMQRKDLQILSNALSSTTMTDAAFVPANAARLQMDFSVTVPTTGITNQKQSGRCWMFSTMNLVRERVIKACNLSDFALSGTYLAFYDKLEKANQFYEAVLYYADQPLNSRENASVFALCCADGGQWGMAAGLMKKYGVVPAAGMPETTHSTGTAEWRDILSEQLHEDGLELREMHARGLNTDRRREEMLSRYYNALCILYGHPVQVFDFEYTDKDNVYHCDRQLTPLSFFHKYIGDDLDEYIGIISAPDHEFGKTYDQPFMGDIVENTYKWLNVPMDQLEQLTINTLKKGEAVMFSCDCHAYRNRSLGIWDQDSMDYQGVLGGLSLGMTKKQKLETGTSTMNHCMLLCGVNLDENGKPNRWKIENSWGDASGQKGYFVCSEKWFREYVYQVFVKSCILTEEQKTLFEQAPISMTFWDPLA